MKINHNINKNYFILKLKLCLIKIELKLCLELLKIF